MANLEWLEIPFRLASPYFMSVEGTPLEFVDFNKLRGTVSGDAPAAGPQWLLDATKCQAGSAKRVTRDNSPQNAGEIVHRHFKTGFVMQLGMIAANVTDIVVEDDGDNPGSRGSGSYEPACGADLVELDDQLMYVLDRIENADGYISWTPSGPGFGQADYPNRELLAARWLGPDGLGGAAFTAVLESVENDVFRTVQFAILSPYPYVVDSNLLTEELVLSTPFALTQDGTTPYWPVIAVNADGGDVTTQFTIANTNSVAGTPPDTALNMIYNPAQPGAAGIPEGQSIRFDFFQNTAYFFDSPNGTGTQLGSAKAGINVASSDFWSLIPGVTNTIELTGDANATGYIEYVGAYV